MCSSNKIDVGAFKASTIFRQSGCDKKEKDRVESMFWEVIESMSNEDRQLVLKFMSGRSRLQPEVEQNIYVQSYASENDFP